MFVLVLIRGCVRLSQLGKGEIKMTGFEIFAWLGVAISGVNYVAEKGVEPTALVASAPAAISASQTAKEKP